VTPELSAALAEAVEQILGTMFYTAGWDAASAPADPICAHLNFSGVPSGEFELRVDCGAARAFAAAYLGLDHPDLTESAAGEMICELANMICGATLSRLHPDAIVKLDTPELSPPRPGGERRNFETPEGLLSVSMRVN
jgi:hypothetical protein